MRHFLISTAVLLLLLPACTGGSIQSTSTPPAPAAEPVWGVFGSASGPGPAAPTSSAAGNPILAYRPGIVQGWQEVEAPGYPSQPGFAMKLPPGWELRERQGIDSYVGEIVGDGARLNFDYGAYSWNLNPADDPEHEYNVTYEEIAGSEAKLIWPKGPSKGFTGVYFSNLGGPRLNIIGKDLTEEQQRIAFTIFRSVRNLE